MCTLTAVLLLASVASNAQATPIFTGTPVSDNATADNYTLAPQTGHGVATRADGAICALYASPSTGLRVARSVDRCAHFLPSVAVNPADAAGSITVSSLGKVYVVFEDAGLVQVSISAD